MKEGDYAEAVKEYQIALDSMPDNQTLVLNWRLQRLLLLLKNAVLST